VKKHTARWTVAVVVVGGMLAAAAWVPLPYYAEGPGPARDVLPLISFEGRAREDVGGRLVYTTVRLRQLTALGLVGAWLDPVRYVIREDELYPPGLDEEREAERSISQMDQSKIDAAFVVLNRLEGYPKVHGEGALVESTAPGCPADGELFPGDVIVGIEDASIDSRREASDAIGAAGKGEPLDFVVEVDGEREEARFTREPCGPDDELLVGVSLLDAFPFEITMSSGDVGGPSAGLMWALGLYELLDDEDLTMGRTIAGTGTIDLEGNVGPIGGIRDKAIAAERAGADVFLVPADNMSELRDADTGAMELLPVATFDEALRGLRSASDGAVPAG
jgi:PDZ domain-containing protein